MIDVAAPAPADVSRKFYSASDNAPTAFILCLATPGVAANVETDPVVLMYSLSQFVSRLGRPAIKWGSGVLASMGYMGASSVALVN